MVMPFCVVRTPPCGLPVLKYRSVVSECGVCVASVDVVCNKFKNGVWDVVLV